MKLYQSCLTAFSLYSKIPVPAPDWQKENMTYAMCFFPLVGVVIGLVLLLWLQLAEALMFSPFLTGVVAVLLPILLSGGIHMDGFCDTADALGSHQSRERKLEILADSRIGAVALMACVLYLLLFCALWSEVDTNGSVKFILVLAPVLSRSLSGLAAVSWKNAKTGGLLATFSQAADSKRVRHALLGWLAVCVLLMMFAGGIAGVVAILLAGMVYWYYHSMSYRQFGGITGDLAGFFLQLCELSTVLAVVLVQTIGGAL